MSLDKSKSWARIYDNGGAKIYEWRGTGTRRLPAAEEAKESDRLEYRRRDDDIEVIGKASIPPLAGRDEDDSDDRSLTDLVEQPAKVMRIGTMIKQLLEEVRAAPLDDASRNRLRDYPRHQHPRAGRRSSTGTAGGTRPSHPAVQRGRGAIGRRVAHRPGSARRLAGGVVSRHPDRTVRPADGRSRAAGADAPGRAAARNRPAGIRVPDNTFKTCWQTRCRRHAGPTLRHATRGWSFRFSMPSHGR